MQPPDGRGVIAAQVLVLALLGEIGRVERLEADEETPEARIHRALDEPGCEHGVHRAGGLPEPSHAPHAVEERRREAAIAEQVIVEEVEMASGQAVDLGQGSVHGSRVERPPALEEGLLVAEVADVRTPARHDDGVGDEVEAALDEIAANRREACQRADRRSIDALGMAAREVREEPRPGVLAGPQEDRVGMGGRLVG